MTQPGWYPDPDDPSARRYFDGTSWSAPLHRDALPAPGPAPQPAPSRPDLGKPDRHGSKWPLVAAAVVVVVAAVALVLWAPWSSDDKAPATVRITDPRVAKSNAGSAFIVDLYGADHADFWRSQSQSRLVDIGAIECLQRDTAESDLQSDFRGLSPDAIREFIALIDKDICPVMERSGGKLP